MIYAICVVVSLVIGFVVGVQAAFRTIEKKLLALGLEDLSNRLNSSLKRNK